MQHTHTHSRALITHGAHVHVFTGFRCDNLTLQLIRGSRNSSDACETCGHQSSAVCARVPHIISQSTNVNNDAQTEEKKTITPQQHNKEERRKNIHKYSTQRARQNARKLNETNETYWSARLELWVLYYSFNGPSITIRWVGGVRGAQHPEKPRTTTPGTTTTTVPPCGAV